MSGLMKVNGFIKSLSAAGLRFTLALTGSAARGELRNNSGLCDYTSDTDILCIIDPKDINEVLSHKKQNFHTIPLILMSSEALNHPSNAVLSINFDSLIENQLKLSKPNLSLIHI